MSYSLACQLRRAAFIGRHFRCESTLRSLSQEEIDMQPPFVQWGRMIREAEKIVGYPTSFMNLRWLLSDEFANVALHLRKLVGSDHPLLTTAKSLLYNQHNNLQPWGLVILLLSKSISQDGNSLSPGFTEIEVYERQRVLAELTEMIRTGHLIHKGLINIPLDQRTKADTGAFGNKIGILIGDYLLVTANGMLAKLRNQDLSYIISSALRDMSEGQFFGDRDVQSFPLPGNPKSSVRAYDKYEISSSTGPIEIEGALGNARREWTVRTMYGGASLLGRGCQGAMLLANQPESCQEVAYLFGCHVGLAWQAASEIQQIMNANKNFSAVSAPVLYALNDDPNIYDVIQLSKDDLSSVDSENLRRKVLSTDAIDRTRQLYEDHAKNASDLATSVGSNQCVEALKKIINTL